MVQEAMTVELGQRDGMGPKAKGETQDPRVSSGHKECAVLQVKLVMLSVLSILQIKCLF